MEMTLEEQLYTFQRDGLWTGDVRPEAVEALDVPEPYRGLLEHERDMTGTLEEFWGARLTLHPLEVHHVGDLLLRRVVLLADERPVEYGAIRIHLNAFTPEAREKIEAGQTPLGAILRTTDMPYRCQPRGYFRVEADPVTRQGLSLGSQGDIVLYGRLAHLTGPEGRTLAQVVEILPPAEPRT